jgi:hypothetical protein
MVFVAAQGTAIAARHSGGLFFGFFLLAAQKKETRPWVREPTFKNSSPQALKTFSSRARKTNVVGSKVPSASLFECGVSPPRDEVLLFRQKYPPIRRERIGSAKPPAKRRSPGMG